MKNYKATTNLMNIVTGAVDTWENWQADKASADQEEFPLSDLENLVEVEKDADAFWIEVK